APGAAMMAPVAAVAVTAVVVAAFAAEARSTGGGAGGSVGRTTLLGETVNVREGDFEAVVGAIVGANVTGTRARGAGDACGATVDGAALFSEGRLTVGVAEKVLTPLGVEVRMGAKGMRVHVAVRAADFAGGAASCDFVTEVLDDGVGVIGEVSVCE